MKDLRHVPFFLLSCTCLLLCAATPVRADIRREAEALVNWKASLAGSHESLGSWSLANSTRLCKWTHILCNSDGHISKLDLSGASLNGTLDRFDFWAFPHLEFLDLSQNDLYGIIPPGIGNLTSLVELYIFNNSLRGAIPRSIGQLKHLAVLELSYLELDGSLPEEIGNMTSLEVLYISSTTLTGSIPLTIGMLVKLQVLWLDNNNLTGSIPMEIGNMTELQDIYSPRNNLEGQLPGTISHLIKLQYFHLFENQLRGNIIPELWNSSFLETVDIEKNNFSGLFPSSICIGGAMHLVIAGYNGFTGIQPWTFRNCTTLHAIDFTENNIAADLRDYFDEHPGQLRVMDFSQNQLYGTLLTNWGEVFLCNFTYLKLLDLSNNALHGALSKCFWDMPSLSFIDLSSNSFTGVVPSSRTCKDSLNYLHLANNHFKGAFPLAIKKCRNLITLDLGGNNFSGTIPSWISKSLPGLKFLRLSSNMFEDDFTNFTGMSHEQGDIDYVDAGYYTHLEQIQIVWKNVDHIYIIMIAGMAGIDLSGNLLSQEIPGGLTTLLELRYLNLSGNHLSGCIPEYIGNLLLLESLDLSRNQLSGEIPPSFAGLKSISTLNLSSNGLSGRIPTSNQLQTLVDPSIYSNNSGLCGFPLEDCVSSSTSKHGETGQGEDMEALWLYCFVAAGFIFGFWLYWSIFLRHSETWGCAFYQHVDNMQEQFSKKVHSCIWCFQATRTKRARLVQPRSSFLSF
uniref:Uncharacterized protein n=1 Tax=Avena sativa TaxID=4498 RepID=A0ACD5WJ11_AVESA